MSVVRSLLGDLVRDVSDEVVDVLHRGSHCRIERIVSNGQCSPPDFWYDQSESEWVVVIAGEAQVRFQAPEELHHLRPGEYLLIPAHCRHRVEWTTPTETTVWLAVFFEEQAT